jgi:hypothetical protein
MIMDNEEEFWDINFCVEWPGHPVIPFKYFATPVAPANSADPKFFERLLHLPPEIVQNVLRFSDASTKFQWMRTCRLFRSMTVKQFWSDPDVWYRVPSSWWNAQKQGHPHSVRLDEEFARQMKQIVIDVAIIERQISLLIMDLTDRKE